MKTKIKSFFNNLGLRFRETMGNDKVGYFLSSLFSAFFFASLVTLFFVLKVDDYPNLNFTGLDYLKYVPRKLFISLFISLFLALIIVSLIIKTSKVIYISLAIITVLFSAILASFSYHDIYLNVGLVILVFLVFLFLLGSEDRLGVDKLDVSKKAGFIVVICSILISTLFLGYFSSLQYRTYSDATFDFGIFAQMMEQMRTTGKPFTTIERGYYLSHFAVHFSPVFYLILPGYFLFPNPVYLYIVQALMVSSGALAVYLIALKLNYKPLHAVIFALIYLLIPTISAACFCDFHENCFLAPFVLFLIYFSIKEKLIPIAVFSILLLMVKEDAVIYLFSFGLYVLLSFKGKKMKLTGLVMIILSIVYFIFAMNMIELAGGKPMLSRFNDYYNSIDGDGFLSILKTIFYDFGYLIKRCFTATYSNEPVAGKIVFLLWVFLPLLFAPFMNKKLGIYVLLVPMGVINLMQYWPYQYNIDFQYTFGSMSLVLFMAIFAIASFNEEKKRLFLYTSLALSFVFFFSVQVSDVTYYDYYYRVNRESFEEVNTLLKEYRPLLKDASVTAEDFLVPELYYVNDLHAMYYYNERPDERLTEYYVINTDSTSQYPKAFLNANYDLVASVRFVNIYKLKDGITPNA